MTQQANNQYCRYCGKHLNEHITGMRHGVAAIGIPDPHGGTFWCSEWHADNHYMEGTISAFEIVIRSLRSRIGRLRGGTWSTETLERYMRKWQREVYQRQSSLRRVGVEVRARFKGPQ